MTFSEILDLTWIPIISFAICLCYGLVLVISKNPQSLKPKDKNVVFRDSEMYAKTAGMLLLFLALGSLIMAFLTFVNELAALFEIIVFFTVFIVFWRKITGKYGPL